MSTDIPVAKLGGIYKRLETDAEYMARICAAGISVLHGTAGRMLDTIGDQHGVQRRIVESST